MATGKHAQLAANQHRQNTAVRLRLEGHTWDEIAHQAGYAHAQGACRAVRQALDRIPADNVQKYRTIEAERLDALHTAYWPAALDGNPKAASIILRISERRAKLLGLDNAEARIADALETSVQLNADWRERLTHAIFTALTRAEIDPDTQWRITQHLNTCLIEVGITTP